MLAPDGKMRSTDVADQEQLFRLVQSIPSPKVEPIKVWIAKVASERIDEMIDPELSIDRATEGDVVFFRRDQGCVEASVLEMWITAAAISRVYLYSRKTPSGEHLRGY